MNGITCDPVQIDVMCWVCEEKSMCYKFYLKNDHHICRKCVSLITKQFINYLKSSENS